MYQQKTDYCRCFVSSKWEISHDKFTMALSIQQGAILCVCLRATGRTSIKLGTIDHHPGVSVMRGFVTL